MNYERVIPRDLFNEASLLKCVGRLWIETEKYRSVTFFHDGKAFDIRQDQGDGSIYIDNVRVFIDDISYSAFRPLNSREPWPLTLVQDTGTGWRQIEVFTDEGKLTEELERLLK